MNTHLLLRRLLLTCALMCAATCVLTMAGCRSGDDQNSAGSTSVDAQSTGAQDRSTDPGDSGAPQSSSQQPLGTGQPSTLLSFTRLPADCGLDFQNRNGEASQQYTILESLGGGVALADIDRDGWDDVLLPGGGLVDENASFEVFPTNKPVITHSWLENC